MVVRAAEEKDRLDYIMLCREFIKESKIKLKTDLEHLSKSFDTFLSNPNYQVFILEEEEEVCGMLVGVLSSPFFATNVFATELVWFTTKDKRGTRGSIQLVNEYEKWAKAKGCDYVTMADLNQIKDLTSFYEKKGYTLAEKAFVKEI